MNPTSIPSSEPGAPSDQRLIRRIRDAFARGDADSAEQLCRNLLERAPAHPDALAYVVLRALAAGQPQQALDFAERAIAAAPAAADGWFQRGCALESLQRPAEAHAAFEGALVRDPKFALAMVWRGAQEEALGRHDDALRTYFAGLTLAQAGGLLEGVSRHPENVRRRLARAYQVVQDARVAAVEQALAPLRERHGAAALERVQHGFDVYAGKRERVWPHPLQRPTFLLIPGLEPKPWFERERFPFLDSIEAETAAIRAEMLAVLNEGTGLQPYVDMPADAQGASVWGPLINNPGWSAFHLYRHGERNAANARRCPRTMAALDAIPIMRIPGHSPEAMFSVLRPRTRIPPHTGVINGRLIVHLPLVVPPDCGMLRAGGEARPWVEGRCMIFDDSMAHEAWNDSDQTRVVLIFDVWNPLLSAAEREAVSAGIDAIGKLNTRCGARDDTHE